MFIVYTHTGNQENCYVLDVCSGAWEKESTWGSYYTTKFQVLWGLRPYTLTINAYNLNDISSENAIYKPRSFTNVKPYVGGVV